MGLMDFLKKRNESGMGSDSLNMDTSPSIDSRTPPSNYGMDFSQQESNLNPSMNLSTMNGGGFGQSSMQQSFSQVPQNNDMQKDLQMISLKLDAIKSEIDAMNQRLKNLESIAEREQMKTNKKWY